MKRIVSTPSAPAAIGPYSQAVVSGGFAFASGQLPLDPATGALVEGGIEVQAARALDNLSAVLAAAGCGLGAVVKTTVFLSDMEDFPAFNRVYATYFPGESPARTTVQAARLPRDARVEVEAVARVE